MNSQGIHLQYSFSATGQTGAQIENPLFDLLAAMLEHGSIRHSAKAMGLSYRHVWGRLRQWEALLGQPVAQWVQGKPAQLTPFGKRLMWAERQARTRMTPHVEALRAELLHVLALAADSHIEVVDVLASHDLGLPRLQALCAARSLHLGLRFEGSEESLRGLNAGRCLLAGFHVPRLPNGSKLFAKALRPLLRPGEHKLIGSHRRQQGLMFAPGAGPVAHLGELAARGLRFVNRQPGSGTRLLMEHLLQEANLPSADIEGYEQRIENTHVAVAAAIASGAADVGLGIEAAAAEFGLDFMPLVEEDYYLVCLKPALESAAVERLCDTLTSRAWGQTVSTMPGYWPHQAGEVLSLTQALPWWRFETVKERSQAEAGN